jgi:hypothetical protein
MIAALFVETDGCYFNLPDVDPWDVARDARTYAGPHAVVAHPPCQLWVNMAGVNFVRYRTPRNRPGNDLGCFAAALESVRTWGGRFRAPGRFVRMVNVRAPASRIRTLAVCGDVTHAS